MAHRHTAPLGRQDKYQVFPGQVQNSVELVAIFLAANYLEVAPGCRSSEEDVRRRLFLDRHHEEP